MSQSKCGTAPTEARPIDLNKLSEEEKGLVERINRTVEAMLRNAKDSEEGSSQIQYNGWGGSLELNRTGRVILIDGKRGSGKTSLLLTLLEQWGPKWSKKDANPEEVSARSDRGFAALVGQLEVHTPPLDFDPLPPGIPLHGWLLLPWKELAHRYCDDLGREKSLLDAWAELFDSAVTGWSSAPVGRGTIERAQNFQDQGDSWFQMRAKYREFVGRVCSAHKSACDRQPLFVIAIDDVDLQVERLSELLHATRLLHHPRVLYILTGNREHLQEVVALDYLRAHVRGLTDVAQLVEMSSALERRSEELARALVEKCVPHGVTFPLEELTLGKVLGFQVGDGLTDADTVKNILNREELRADLSPETVKMGDFLDHHYGSRKVLLARQAQQALDRWKNRSPRAVSKRELSPKESPKVQEARALPAEVDELLTEFFGKFVGTLTTHRAPPDTSDEVGQARVIVAGKDPRFVFIPASSAASLSAQPESDAMRALVVQIVRNEHAGARTTQLRWAPEAGVIRSEYTWSGRTLVFHWQWLERPKAAYMGDWFRRLHSKIDEKARVATAIVELHTVLLEEWVRHNLVWSFGERYEDRAEFPSLGSLLGDLVRMLEADPESEVGKEDWNRDNKAWNSNGFKNVRGSDFKIAKELDRWAVQVLVLGAPFYGLPPEPSTDATAASAATLPVDAATRTQPGGPIGTVLDGLGDWYKRRASTADVRRLTEEVADQIKNALTVAISEGMAKQDPELDSSEKVDSKVKEFQRYYQRDYGERRWVRFEADCSGEGDPT